ncbi:MAG: hypothetical protein A2487_13945 [Candidatus Raymondbacteria bacterium RifOxyC12_full_50_8]|uniref:Type 4 fimbrial biogenesis protein PilX N-terminal domain-containing protein n=1 Tax=Candidatus Raymondbacteria bacterium RIFOXYD12_FULL_49_13 TaxID=1817890 RepID=A0A1F7FBV5_UNCRA|nr:MAG: hypothetical protein A2248_05700 [Candidatus Raymondbacteria bacterium RIFOXYA2_FULL_49_16]OGJ97919.1 MAG: hypothetical protein A2453_02725 [Candidatus Raymondbacteria bacterium RIFOXYC2_FULL_50_21]OGK03966.1 MAG: hypothetical protein A2519_04560 [Candidatus Raymondbacteria bacterium RIFOXYD12_FULL_49_13]OGK04351.1 MAG: hypothetical protein A2487_13945 [Candidatus Raymondbacteria bacterium RifOxyC12_full_50_8]OGP44804.1 MAG: hypothetical protein A2324_21460 [Candidatus Raymondbacteria b
MFFTGKRPLSSNSLSNQDGYIAYLVLTLLVIIAFLLNAVFLGYARQNKGLEDAKKKIQLGYVLRVAEDYIGNLMNSPDGPIGLLAENEFKKELDPESGFIISASRKGCVMDCVIKARYKDRVVTVNKTIGQRHKYLQNSALYVFGGMSGLILGGKAAIEGDVHLPSGTVNTSSSGYFRYTGQVPVKGRVLGDAGKYDAYLDNRLAMAEAATAEALINRVVQKGAGAASGNISGAFSNPGTVYEHSGDAILDNAGSIDMNKGTLVMTGNLFLKGQSSLCNGSIYIKGAIELRDNSSLTEVIVVSGNGISAFNQTALKGQFFTSGTISINNYTMCRNFTLLFSDPMLFNNETGSPGIRIMDRAKVHGVAVLNAPEQSRNIGFVLDEEATINGFLYCSAGADIRGMVMGQTWVSTLACQYDRTLHGSTMKDGRLEVLKQDWQIYVPPLFGVKKDLAFYDE